MERLTGSCLCGDVRIEASGRPYRVGICHCLDCRKHHGALFHASAIFPSDAVTIEGETRDFAGRSFCPRCGSSIFGQSGDEVEVSLGSLESPDQFVPTYELWTIRREILAAAFPTLPPIRARSRGHRALGGVIILNHLVVAWRRPTSSRTLDIDAAIPGRDRARRDENGPVQDARACPRSGPARARGH